ncbi:MAG: hypothetical protein ACQERL_04975 [Bacillota bacterium]
MMIFKLIIFSYANYLLTEYFREKETAYLFLGSMTTALVYLLLPEFIIIFPFYLIIFFLALDEKEKKKRPAQLLTFSMPTLAAVFSLSYISWVYGYGMRLIYLSGSIFDLSKEGAFNLNFKLFSVNLSKNIPIIALIYLFILLWLLFKKTPFRVYLYLYLSPIILYTGYSYLYGINAGIVFYVPMLLLSLFFFVIFSEEFSLTMERFFYFFLLINFLTLFLYLLAVITIVPAFEINLINFLSEQLNPVLIYFKEYAVENWPGPEIELIRYFYFR